ncbi:MAG: hypothetical protein DRN61_06905, partial [Thaumarchaeota archaeon]
HLGFTPPSSFNALAYVPSRGGLSWEASMARGLAPLILAGLRAAREALGRRLRSACLHCDGSMGPGALKAVRAALEEASALGLVQDGFRWVAVEVKSRAVPRLLSRQGLRLYTPEKGSYVELDAFKAVVATTGFPEHPPLSAQAPPRPVLVEVVDANWWELTAAQLARDIYWLSELHWASGLRSPRLPVTTLYPKRLASFWRAGVMPSEELYGRLWFL